MNINENQCLDFDDPDLNWNYGTQICEGTGQFTRDIISITEDEICLSERDGCFETICHPISLSNNSTLFVQFKTLNRCEDENRCDTGLLTENACTELGFTWMGEKASCANWEFTRY